MGKHGWLILVALWLAACTAAPTASPTPPATAMAQLPTATASPRPATATRLPTITPTPSRTATHTRPPTATATITPSPSNTFDPQATVATATPAPAAVCPTADPNASPSLDFLTPPDGFYELGNSDSYQQQALDYLNLAGPDGIRLAMAAQGKIEGVDYAYADLTNDGVSEIVLPLGLIHVFGCQEGHYKDLLTVGPTDILTPRIGGIADLNKDGLPELLTKSLTEAVGGT